MFRHALIVLLILTIYLGVSCKKKLNSDFEAKKIYHDKIELLIPKYMSLSKEEIRYNDFGHKYKIYSFLSPNDTVSFTAVIDSTPMKETPNWEEVSMMGKKIKANDPHTIILKVDTMTINNHNYGYIEYNSALSGDSTFLYNVCLYTMFNHYSLNFNMDYRGNNIHNYNKDAYTIISSLKIADL